MMDRATTILTSVSPYLEGTAILPTFHCLLRVCVRPTDDIGIFAPDLATLRAVPIHRRGEDARSGGSDEAIALLPKLSSRNGNVTSSRESQAGHASHELIRTACDLEDQLTGRLRDASEGSVQAMDPAYRSTNEEFLVRADAIFEELVSAVLQQIRKDEQARQRAGGNRRGSKRQRTSGPAKRQPPLRYYDSLTQQLRALQPVVEDIALEKEPNDSRAGPGDLTRLSVTFKDAGGRSHTWRADLYPAIIITVDLPGEEVDLDRSLKLDRWWEAGGEVLPAIHRQISAAIDEHQVLFDELDDIDSNLWVLEPTLPAGRKSVERRLALWEGGASLAMTLDPDDPRGPPVLCRFLGVTPSTLRDVAKAQGNGEPVDFRKSFKAFVSEESGANEVGARSDSPTKHWSRDRSVRENLETWFGQTLPSPLSKDADRSDFLVECGICYAHRLPLEDDAGDEEGKEEGPLPEIKCANCNRHYHEACLFEWLHSLPTARVSFDRVFGPCVYCGETVSVKVQKGT
ncbi:hypothetical protein THAOC_21811 [Thalassiosira oceanica]|uniref:RING-type domain-containing protein n=1 Tax=Thalassiosira oceanica TaxID=159749 RepID=K0RWA9_THAOC|nr:hypothetical protein THAOC_21811 [Thalassiosira oceanica]|mmetsp:Transcript_12675/g.29949  ORF Transcript_12675/g.29949 Transcript_12675/m.29949 type:complete len:515 (-) Transcript_12675:787-2331(-)|eukprot:EJK58088.1 hypothetical protein THAOC_21811 [Thalassiosira oceanica]